VGALTLPVAGPVYLDATAFIYAVETVEPYCTVLAPLWAAAQAGRFEIVTSELTWLETLAKPLREGDLVREEDFRRVLTDSRGSSALGSGSQAARPGPQDSRRAARRDGCSGGL
jgi:hypothetical protein